MGILDRFFRPEKPDVPEPDQHLAGVLFVCMGNICRSPTAEGVLRQRLASSGLARHVLVDSAGTHAGHVGSPPDRRSQEAAARRGVDLSRLRARRLEVADLDRFDYVLAMDLDNLAGIQTLAGNAAHRAQLGLLLDFAPQLEVREVPDPYYGGRSGFERVLDLIDAGVDGLFDHLRRQHRF